MDQVLGSEKEQEAPEKAGPSKPKKPKKALSHMSQK